MPDPLAHFWADCLAFLDGDPAPKERKKFTYGGEPYGEVRYTMGLHRLYLLRGMTFDGETLRKLEEVCARHSLRQDAREAPAGGRANIVLFQGDRYIGRLKNEEPILMPQNMDEELFCDLVGLTSPGPA